MTTRTNRFTKLTPTYLATAGPLSQTPPSTSGASGSGAQAVADDVLHLLQRANHRAEVHVKQTQNAKKTTTRRTAKARRDAEALLSTDVLLDIAKRRSDVGEVLCAHCSNSLKLADALPSLTARGAVPQTRRIKGAFVIAGSKPSGPPPLSSSAAEPGAGRNRASPRPRTDPAIEDEL